jgi:hypothetical protein
MNGIRATRAVLGPRRRETVGMDPGFAGAPRRRQLRTVLFFVVGLLAASLVAVGQAAPQVRQPDDASFSAEAKAALAKGLATLQAILADPSWGSGRTLGLGGWGAREFAIYTAGVLGERGYSVTVVRSDSSANARTWLLVGLSVPGTLAWVPVEPSPGAGQPQTSLGRIPMSGSAFASAYVSYASVVTLPPNAPPIARIRPPATRQNPGQVIQILALGSVDPDGMIVVYRWDFGDGTTATFRDGTAVHTFAKSGNYTITLTVIDNGGRSGVATWVLPIGSDAPAASETPKPDCGCGK